MGSELPVATQSRARLHIRAALLLAPPPSMQCHLTRSLSSFSAVCAPPAEWGGKKVEEAEMVMPGGAGGQGGRLHFYMLV